MSTLLNIILKSNVCDMKENTYMLSFNHQASLGTKRPVSSNVYVIMTSVLTE
jgi:hypothetical protein